MKKLLLLAVFLFPAIALGATTPQAADFDLTMHVTHSQLILECSSGICNWELHLHGTIAGKKVEVVENKARQAVLHPGDYKARISKSGEGKTRMGQAGAELPYEDQIIYELMLPDGTTRQFMLIGEEE